VKHEHDVEATREQLTRVVVEIGDRDERAGGQDPLDQPAAQNPSSSS
jgi:hypothetical protein